MHDDTFTRGRRGEFRGDFTRDTFDPLRRCSRVLMQQGRVQLDADWNEQISIFLHYLRSLAADIIGPHGAPPKADSEGGPANFDGDGFKIMEGNPFTIHNGHYYVNGILCENDRDVDYYDQPDDLFTDEEKISLPSGEYLVYLDVWERHLSYVEDDYMREKALNGPDTATRAKIIWQVKYVNHEVFDETMTPSKFKVRHEKFLEAIEFINRKQPGTGLLRARAKRGSSDNNEPCLISPTAQYRGAENQLYRVEIHTGSTITEGHISNEDVTFKFSRENGAAIFPIVDIAGKIITLEHLGRDARFGLKPNDWMEIVDDKYILENRADALWQVETVDSENSTITVKSPSKSTESGDSSEVLKVDLTNKVGLSAHPYIRRWDQKDGDRNGVPLQEMEGSSTKDWIPLEDGIEIQFLKPAQEDDEEEEEVHLYHTGDYWLIPARTATGDVEWPGPKDNPHSLPAQGVDHHYAPLANITVDANGKVTEEPIDLRRKLKQPWK